jgi:hypothetical protein
MTMILNYHGRNVTVDDVLIRALERQAFDTNRGWLHSNLVTVLRSFGLAAHRRNWRLLDGHENQYLAGRSLDEDARLELENVRSQMLDEGIWRLRQLLSADLPVTVSVHRPRGDDSSIGHQVVLLGEDAQEFIYHDPAQDEGPSLSWPFDNFRDNWKGLAIIAHSAALSPNKG